MHDSGPVPQRGEQVGAQPGLFLHEHGEWDAGRGPNKFVPDDIESVLFHHRLHRMGARVSMVAEVWTTPWRKKGNMVKQRRPRMA